MDSFAEMLTMGMRNRGHHVQLWYPEPVLSKLPGNKFLKKWLGYIDQYLIFPSMMRQKIKKSSASTLFVFTDQALGPWVPIVKKYPHVIHCHDFLALSSAKGDVHENATGWTGRMYQHLIQRGYSCGENFISVSKNTQDQLNKFLLSSPKRSTVIYNGIKRVFLPCEPSKARAIVETHTGVKVSSGYVLHIGGNQWYKNRIGVIEIYNAWRLNSESKLPLLLIGESPSIDLINKFNLSPFKADIHFLSGMEDKFLCFAYAGASVFLFPSLAEGFGWPIVEAMACGCKVITTKEAPMTEIAGNAGFYISRRPRQTFKIEEWAKLSAKVVDELITLGVNDNKRAIETGFRNAKRFDIDITLDQMEAMYKEILMQNC